MYTLKYKGKVYILYILANIIPKHSHPLLENSLTKSIRCVPQKNPYYKCDHQKKVEKITKSNARKKKRYFWYRP